MVVVVDAAMDDAVFGSIAMRLIRSLILGGTLRPRRCDSDDDDDDDDDGSSDWEEWERMLKLSTTMNWYAIPNTAAAITTTHLVMFLPIVRGIISVRVSVFNA